MIKRDFRVKMDIKLTRKTSLYDLIKMTNVFELVLGIKTCVKVVPQIAMS